MKKNLFKLCVCFLLFSCSNTDENFKITSISPSSNVSERYLDEIVKSDPNNKTLYNFVNLKSPIFKTEHFNSATLGLKDGRFIQIEKINGVFIKNIYDGSNKKIKNIKEMIQVE